MAKKKGKERKKKGVRNLEKLRCNSIVISYFVVFFLFLFYFSAYFCHSSERFFPPRITLVEKLYLEIVCIVTLLLLNDNVKLSTTL